MSSCSAPSSTCTLFRAFVSKRRTHWRVWMGWLPILFLACFQFLSNWNAASWNVYSFYDSSSEILGFWQVWRTCSFLVFVQTFHFVMGLATKSFKLYSVRCSEITALVKMCSKTNVSIILELTLIDDDPLIPGQTFEGSWPSANLQPVCFDNVSRFLRFQTPFSPISSYQWLSYHHLSPHCNMFPNTPPPYPYLFISCLFHYHTHPENNCSRREYVTPVVCVSQV